MQHGPVVQPDGPRPLALHWTAKEPGFRFPLLMLNQASTWQQFRAAVAEWKHPPFRHKHRGWRNALRRSSLARRPLGRSGAEPWLQSTAHRQDIKPRSPVGGAVKYPARCGGHRIAFVSLRTCSFVLTSGTMIPWRRH